MNKLLVVEDKSINSGEYILDIKKDVSLNINGNVVIHDINSDNKWLDIIIENNCNFDLYHVKKLQNDYYIHITLLNNAILNLNMLILNENNHQVKVDIDMTYDNSIASTHVRALNIQDNSNLDVIFKGYIKEKTKGNELVEDLKGLLVRNNDTIKISPIMIVDTNEVLANHLVTIGNFNTEELFYLESLGLSEKMAKDMLIESFMKQNMSEVELEFLKLGGDKDE